MKTNYDHLIKLTSGSLSAGRKGGPGSCRAVSNNAALARARARGVEQAAERVLSLYTEPFLLQAKHSHNGLALSICDRACHAEKNGCPGSAALGGRIAFVAAEPGKKVVQCLAAKAHAERGFRDREGDEKKRNCAVRASSCTVLLIWRYRCTYRAGMARVSHSLGANSAGGTKQ